jgi:hypothetical protein
MSSICDGASFPAFVNCLSYATALCSESLAPHARLVLSCGMR